MAYEMVCGIQEKALRVVVYGPEGIGKSTLAAEFPSPVFIDVEGGTNQLPVARFPRPTSWAMLLDMVQVVQRGEVECSTLVIDTADAAEALCTQATCAEAGKEGIEDFGYGKGYTYLAENFSKLLAALNHVVDAGVNVVVLSHATMRKFERPDETGAYDRFELKLSKKVAPMVKEWADMVLFCDYKTYVVVDSSGKAKAQGGKRIIRTTHAPQWDAKNRFGLPDELDMELGKLPDELAKAIPDMRIKKPNRKATKKRQKATQSDQEATQKPAGDNDGQTPYERPDYPENLSQLADLMEVDHVTDEELRHAVGQTGNFPESCKVTDYEQGYVDFLVSQWAPMLNRIKANRVEVPFD